MERLGIQILEPPKEEKKKSDSQLAIEALELKLYREKDEHERTKELHKLELSKAQKRYEDLDNELSLALRHLQRSEEAHHNEIIRLEGEVTRGVQERHRLTEKLDQITVVEDAVKDLYLHMKERTSEAELTYEQLQYEREILKGQNVLVVLGALHASLKSLWTFKVEAEAELRGRAMNRTQAASEKTRMLEDQMRKLQLAKTTAQAEMEDARRQLKAEQESRAQTLRECEAQQAEMVAMQQELTKELKQLVEENKQLRAAIALAHEEGRKRDELVLQNKELQSERHFEKISSTNKLRQQWHEHLLIMQEMEKEVKKREMKIAEKKDVETRLQEVRTVMESQKRSLSMQHVKGLEEKVTRLGRALADRDRRIRHLEKMVASMRGSDALTYTKKERKYNWGRGGVNVEDSEEPGDPNHPMQKELVDVKTLHKKAVTSIDNLKVELDQPPFVDKLMYDMRNQMSAPRRGLGGSSFRSTASARPGGSIDVKSPASLGRLNSHRSNISAGAKEAAKAQRPRTADPTAVP